MNRVKLNFVSFVAMSLFAFIVGCGDTPSDNTISTTTTKENRLTQDTKQESELRKKGHEKTPIILKEMENNSFSKENFKERKRLNQYNQWGMELQSKDSERMRAVITEMHKKGFSKENVEDYERLRDKYER